MIMLQVSDTKNSKYNNNNKKKKKNTAMKFLSITREAKHERTLKGMK